MPMPMQMQMQMQKQVPMQMQMQLQMPQQQGVALWVGGGKGLTWVGKPQPETQKPQIESPGAPESQQAQQGHSGVWMGGGAVSDSANSTEAGGGVESKGPAVGKHF